MAAFDNWDFETEDSCPLCGGTLSNPVVERSVRDVPLRFVKCDGCQLVYQNPRLSLEAAEQYFGASSFLKDEGDGSGSDGLLGYQDYDLAELAVRRTARYRLRRIAKARPPPARLLEIGSATGVFLDEARSMGYRVRGLDISKAFAEKARQDYALDIDIGPIETFPIREHEYDVICCWGGIACWHDFLVGLGKVRKALRQGGVFLMNHPNVGSPVARILGTRYYEYNHSVFTVFSKRTMDRTLEKAGFRSLVRQVDRQFAALGWILAYLRSGIGLKAARMLHLDRVVIPVLAGPSMFRVCTPVDD